VNVTCCTLALASVTVTCGRGASCAASCTAEEATLCPSGACEDCRLQDYQSYPNQTENSRKTRQAFSTQASSSINWCPRKGRNCQVGKYPVCCFHPSCRYKKKDGSLRGRCSKMGFWSSKYALLCSALLCIDMQCIN
jgi:hypothetical protein